MNANLIVFARIKSSGSEGGPINSRTFTRQVNGCEQTGQLVFVLAMPIGRNVRFACLWLGVIAMGLDSMPIAVEIRAF